jgi:hypothetical protein
MLKVTAATLFVLVAATGCKKEKKPDAVPPVGSASAAVAPVDKGSAGSDMTAPKVDDKGSAAMGSDKGSAAAAAPAELKWEKFTSKDGGFSIDLPSKPEEQEQGGMKIVGAQFGKTATDDREAMCGVAYMNLGDAAKGDPKVMLDGATARHKQGAKVMEEKDVKLGKYPGRSIVVQNDTHRKWMRVYIVEKNIYVLNCGGPFDRGDADGLVAVKALDSFALTK